MNPKQPQGQFTELNSQERDARFSELAKNGELLTVWIKGSTSKFFFKCKGFAPHNRLLELIPREAGQFTELDKKEVLISFFIKSLQFFFTGNFVIEHNNQTYLVKGTEKLFKFERRKNFRLSTDVTHNVKIYLKLPKDFYKPSNVVNLRNNGDQTKLFKKFLELVNDQTDIQKNYPINFRVHDLSTTGLSFIMGELERKLIGENSSFEKVLLEFNNKSYIIPRAKVVYIMDYINRLKPGVKFYKVGMTFEEVDLALDNELSIQINTELREADTNKIFEDFLK